MKPFTIARYIVESIMHHDSVPTISYCPVSQPDMRMEAKAVRVRLEQIKTLGTKYLLARK